METREETRKYFPAPRKFACRHWGRNQGRCDSHAAGGAAAAGSGGQSAAAGCGAAGGRSHCPDPLDESRGHGAGRPSGSNCSPGGGSRHGVSHCRIVARGAGRQRRRIRRTCRLSRRRLLRLGSAAVSPFPGTPGACAAEKVPAGILRGHAAAVRPQIATTRTAFAAVFADIRWLA